MTLKVNEINLNLLDYYPQISSKEWNIINVTSQANKVGKQAAQ